MWKTCGKLYLPDSIRRYIIAIEPISAALRVIWWGSVDEGEKRLRVIFLFSSMVKHDI